MSPPFKNVFDLVQGRSHWSWLYSALSTIRDLFTIAQFRRITRPHQAFPFTTWQRVQVGRIIIDSVRAFLLQIAGLSE
jgi:hypothetical protein